MSTFPTTPAPYEVVRSSLTQTFLSVAHSMRAIRSTRGGQRWKFELSYRNLARSEMRLLEAFINSQHGRLQAFDFVPPTIATLGSFPGTPLVDGSGQSGSILLTKGWTPSQSDVLKAGDFINVSGSAKTYQITADVASDAAGLASVPLFPQLDYDYQNDAAIIADNVFRCAIDTDSFSLSMSDTALHSFTLPLIEVLG